MLTTTPLRMPLDSCCPRPSTSNRPSGNTWATTATTLLVPISRATIRSLMSRVMALTLLLGLNRFRQLGQGKCEPIRVSQVGVGHGAAFEPFLCDRPHFHKTFDSFAKWQRTWHTGLGIGC